jgi:Sec-independent protein secretion pathway component TatC
MQVRAAVRPEIYNRERATLCEAVWVSLVLRRLLCFCVRCCTLYDQAVRSRCAASLTHEFSTMSFASEICVLRGIDQLQRTLAMAITMAILIDSPYLAS